MDVKIVREFVQDRGSYPVQSDIRRSFRTVAENLGIDEATVRNRIRKMRESGFMKDWYVLPNPWLSYLRVAHARWDVHQVSWTTKDEVLRKIKLMQGVWTIINYFGSSMRAVLYFEDEASLGRQIELIARISNSDDILCREIHFPPCAMPLSEDDLTLVICIQTDPTKPYTKISKETGLSSRAVKRRLERMLQGRALFSIPSIDPSSFIGGTLAELFVFFEGPEAMRKAKDRMTAHMGEYLVWTQLADYDHMLFQLVVTNISQVKTILNWVKQQPGVKNVYLDLVEERVELYEVFGQQLKRKLGQVHRTGGGAWQPAAELGIVAASGA